MTDPADYEVADAEAAATRRNELVAAVTDHAGIIARELALLQGGDYGQASFKTSAGEWTVKYEAGDLEYLRFETRSGRETYVVSTKQPPDAAALADAMEDYGAFVRAFNDHVRSKVGVLDDVPEAFPDVVSTADAVAERDRIVGRIRETCDAIADQLHRYEGGDYGTFAARVDGSRWELKREASSTAYLRVGGSGGVYLVSQYEPPSAEAVRDHVEGFTGFVEAFNDHVEEVEADLSRITL
ncbi:hypothetical protein [Halomarina oriensis]|uniref:Profilin fold domain-containing protein n=1 Tax=Halomarina oriensis TaxID=671145 RepID=A0A6B0GYY9_9EURY|nr:hypothetical protein [Halomarina oriensis]MWG36978.1 hypothetical protein [Halomarina oriensis]